jgi:serine/threonine-protein kinase
MTDERRLIGTVIDGRYRVSRVLGVGGMSTVYQAHDERLDRPVAVKVISRSLGADESFIRRFSTEARASARLAHPNVVHVLDRSDEQSLPYIVFEYVPGRTLRQLIRDEAPLPNREALRLWRQLIEALSHAHEAGIIHRDVKPDNVLVTDRGHAKLTDFGLARAVAEARTTATIMGTARYVAAEVISDNTSDARSDLYSAGILLFELLTGAPPFTGANPINVAYAHVHRDVPAPSTREPSVHAEMDSLVLWCCARDPERRPQSAADLLPEIDHILSLLPPDPSRPPRRLQAASPATERIGSQPEDPTQAVPTIEALDESDLTAALTIANTHAWDRDAGGAAPTQALPAHVPPVERKPLVPELPPEDDDGDGRVDSGPRGDASSEPQRSPVLPTSTPVLLQQGSSTPNRRERRAQARAARQPLRSVRKSGNSSMTSVLVLLFSAAIIALGLTLYSVGDQFFTLPW